jgi:hypothetical protein
MIEPCLTNDRGRPTEKPAHEAEGSGEAIIGNAISNRRPQGLAGRPPLLWTEMGIAIMAATMRETTNSSDEQKRSNGI